MTRKMVNLSNVTIDNNRIEQLREFKYLGVTYWTVKIICMMK